MKTLREMMDLIEAAQRPHQSNTKNPVDFPRTWHDVDPKLGKQVDKMSQAEKVKKGFAHPDTLKKKGVAEGFFGIDDKIKGKIQNLVSRLSDEYGMWDHKAQTFTPQGLETLKSMLKFNERYIKYALSLTHKDYEAEGVAEEQLEETTPEALAKIDELTRK